MDEWYFFDDNQQIGPYRSEYAKAFVREHPAAYCWRSGWHEWKLVFEVPEIRRLKKDGITPFPPPPPHLIGVKPHQLPISSTSALVNNVQPSRSRTITYESSMNATQGFGSATYTEGIDYRIYGTEMQFVVIELDSNESAIAEAGAMMYKSASVTMETVFGDASSQGLLGSLWSMGRRLLTNESLFTTVFTQTGAGKGQVGFAAPYPGTILALQLKEYQGQLICQKDSFLAGVKGINVGIHFQQRILTGLFGGEGFIMQKLEGDGWVFIHVGGTLHKIELAYGETIHVDTGCVAAFTSGVDFDIQQAGGIKSMLFGGEGLVFAKLTGPGTVWIQSLPFSRLAGRMLASSPQMGTQQRDEGSVLGGFGNFFDGDNR
ncbi:MAG: hypothetical protein RL637_1324 [Pseudomonadota bacterium]